MKNSKYITMISLIILIITTIFVKEVGNLDELWNFNFARNIVNGLLPYKDFNIITTPLYPFINSILLSLGNYLYVFRITYILLIIFNLYLIYKILSYFKLNYNAIFICMLIVFLFLSIFTYSDYNFLQNILILLIIYYEIKIDSSKKNNLYNIILGILLGLTIVNKQTTGLIITIICLFIPIIYSLYLKEKINIKKYLLSRIIGLLIPIIVLFLYLNINNLWSYFFDLTILGIKTFSNSLFTPSIVPLLMVLIVFYIIIILKVKKEKQKIDIIFLLYSLGALTVIYPIFDMTHLIYGIIPIVVYVFYYLTNLKLIKYNKKYNFIFIFISIILLVVSCNNVSKYFVNIKNSNYSTYDNLLIDNNLLFQLDSISEYLNNNDKVIILNFDAAFYMIANNRYNKNYDLFMNGNFGYNGEKNIYKDLDNNDYTILINDNFKHYQQPTKIVEHVKENYTNVGSVSGYSIYKKI